MKKLTLEDYNLIKPYFDKVNYPGYNYDFTTLMMWKDVYKSEYEIHDDYLLILHTFRDIRFFIMPYCSVDAIDDAFIYMKEYANKNGFTFYLDAVSPKIMNHLKSIYKKELLYIKTPDYYDYVYSYETLVTLRGKKMQKRRNHFNAFLNSEVKYSYKNYDDSDYSNVIDFYDKWYLLHPDIKEDVKERSGISTLLQNMDILNVKAGCIYHDTTLVAFTIASLIHGDTVHIHVEKADKDIRGLYVAINKMFLEENFTNATYVNREEDMGYDHLRHAKRAMHPLFQVEKYCIVENNIEISLLQTDKELQEVKELWQNLFVDEDSQSTEFYFNNVYKPSNIDIFLAKDKGQIVGMLQIREYEIHKQNNVYFILGVGTKEEYRYNGILDKMMDYIYKYPKFNNKRLFLQAYNPEIYEKYGFKKQLFMKKYDIDKSLIPKKDLINSEFNVNDLVNLYNQYCGNFNSHYCRDKEYYANYLIPRCEVFNQSIVTVYENGVLDSYAVYSINNNKVSISELIYTNKESVLKILSMFTSNDTIELIIDSSIELPGEYTLINTMMTNDNYIINDNIYINEIY